jgi:putative oxidoreductase
MLSNLDSAFDNMTRPLHGIAFWPLRLAMAGIFLYHGPGKFMMPEMAGMMGLSQPVWLLVGTAEVLGGAGFIVGGLLPGAAGAAITRLAGLAVIPVMLGAIAMVHWGQWNFVASGTHPMGGMEFQVLILSVAIYALLTGFARVTQEQAYAAPKPMGSQPT